jgi:hypothetical protein
MPIFSLYLSYTHHNTLDIFTLSVSVSYRDLTRRTPLKNSSRELLLNNWLLRHSSSSYITLNHTSVTVSWKGCLRSVSEQQARWGLCYVTRGNAKVTWYSPTTVAVCRHRGMLRRNRIPILLRDVIASVRKSCLPVGYLATLCCVTQQWVDMSQYLLALRTCSSYEMIIRWRKSCYSAVMPISCELVAQDSRVGSCYGRNQMLVTYDYCSVVVLCVDSVRWQSWW